MDCPSYFMAFSIEFTGLFESDIANDLDEFDCSFALVRGSAGH